MCRDRYRRVQLRAENGRLRRRVAALERRLLFTAPVLSAQPETRSDSAELAHVEAQPAPSATRVDQATLVGQLDTLALQGEQLAASARMAALIAHELNTPLQAAENYLFLADAEGAEVERLRPVQQELQRIATIVRRLLSFQLAETQCPMPVAVNDLVERVLLLTSSRLQTQRVVLVRRLEPSLPNVMGHDRQLTLVLLNLVLRAAEALSAGGELAITTNSSTMGSGSTITIELSYSGTEQWIEPAAAAPHYSTEGAEPELRLEICRRLLASHGGSLMLWEELGGGQRAVVALPLRTMSTS